MTLEGLRHYLGKKGGWFFFLASRNLLNRMPDRPYLERTYRYSLDTPLSLDNPRTFNEKTQWLKLYDRNPRYSALVDKYEVREYVAGKIGEEYLIPLVGGPWDSPDEIDFDSLPSRFVLKCTHDSGSLIICRDKNGLDREAAKRKLEKSVKRNYFWTNREWPYKNVKPRIIAEQYMEDESGTLLDYKFFTFSGEPFCVQVDYDRFTDHHRNFYDLNWTYMPFTTEYPTDPSHQIPRPVCFDEMLRIVRCLASDRFPFLRVDLYVVNDRPLFGELTFYHGSGMEHFLPEEWDGRLGELLILPDRKT